MGKLAKVLEKVNQALDMSKEARMARAKDAGNTTDSFHGSTHDLVEMNASKTNVEGDWGRGIYSSNSIDDVNVNYAGVGPDLTLRIELEADRLENELLEQFQEKGRLKVLESLQRSMDDLEFIGYKIAKMDDSDAARKAAEILSRKTIKGANDGVVYPLKQNTSDFATIGGKDGTVIQGRDYHAEAREEINRADYLDDYEYDDAVDEYAYDLLNSDYDTNYQKVMDVIDKHGGGISVDELGEAFDGDSVDVTKLDEIIRNLQIYAEDDLGNIIPQGAVSAEILRNLGFKGVIDKTVNKKFGTERKIGRPMGGMDEDTIHYITFEGSENLIRSPNAAFDPAKKDSSNLLAGVTGANVGTSAILSDNSQAQDFTQRRASKKDQWKALRDRTLGAHPLESFKYPPVIEQTIEAPKSQTLLDIASAAQKYNDFIDKPLINLIAPELPAELWRKQAYGQPTTLGERSLAALAMSPI